MTTYSLNEGTFELPVSGWQDNTMNVFRDPVTQHSLVINRGRIQPGRTDLLGEMTAQIEPLRGVATGVTVGEFSPVRLDNAPGYEALETTLTFVRDKLSYYQFQLSVLQNDKENILVFTYTSLLPFTEADHCSWNKLKNSISLTD